MKITAIYDEDLVEILGRITPDISIKRASNVEPYQSLPGPVKARINDISPLNWWAYMIEADVILGPFKARSEALKAEVEFLKGQLKNS